MSYKTLHIVRHVMPDDHLVNVRLDQDTLIFEYRAWFIHPRLVHRMGLLSRAVAGSGYIDLGLPSGDPSVAVWFEAVPPEYIPHAPLAYRIGVPDSVLFFELSVWDIFVHPDLIRELNEEVMPQVCEILTPVV